MIVVTDCGGTKGDWRYISPDGTITGYETRGFSPVVEEASMLKAIMENELSPPAKDVSAVYYYGTGVHGDTITTSVTGTLQAFFNTGRIEVNPDLLGACRATSGDRPGIISILGTGMSSCFYDGKKMIDRIPSLGYIAGDEGGGSQLGLRLVKTYFYREMPPEINAAFEATYSLRRDAFIHEVYKKPGANSYLASFSDFVIKNRANKFIRELILDEFNEFISRHLIKYEKYPDYKCHFVGSVAWFLKEELKTGLDKAGLKPGIFLRKPIDQLVSFHLNKIQ